ncbi:hypothetical protein M8494_29045 [Serratia ureilytica]
MNRLPAIRDAHERIQTMLQRLSVNRPWRAAPGDMVGFAHPLQLVRTTGVAGRTTGAIRRRAPPAVSVPLSRRNLQRLRQHVQYRANSACNGNAIRPVARLARHRHQRMPAQFEEVVAATDALYAQQLAPDSRQQVSASPAAALGFTP